MLKNSVLQNIISILDNSQFSQEDFQITNEDFTKAGFSIKCILDNNFYFKVTSDYRGYTLAMSPGMIQDTESIKIELTKIPDYVTSWTQYVYSELTSSCKDSTIFKIFKDEILEEIEKNKSKYSEENFSDEEITEETQKLEKLQAAILELQEKLSLSDNELLMMKADIAMMKTMMTKITKASWLKFVSNKFIRWARKSVNAEGVGKILGAATKQFLS